MQNAQLCMFNYVPTLGFNKIKNFSCCCTLAVFFIPSVSQSEQVTMLSFQQVLLFSPNYTWVLLFCGSCVNIHSPSSDLHCFALFVFIFVFFLPLLQGLGDDVIGERAKIWSYELRRGHHWLTVLNKTNNVSCDISFQQTHKQALSWHVPCTFPLPSLFPAASAPYLPVTCSVGSGRPRGYTQLWCLQNKAIKSQS